ncbi:MAG: hypothetical protein LKM34_07365 [Prevotella sp.]|nr:hypothetical protein [Prevotella sp.]
MLYVLIKPEKF